MSKSRLFTLPFFIVFFLGACSQAQLASADLQFAKGKDVVEIPFERDRGWIIIKVQVNGVKELSFILDTGAPIAVLVNDKLANELKLNIHGDISVKGTDGKPGKSVQLAQNVKFTIGDIEITNGFMAIGAATAAVSGVDGIIGKYLFEDAVLRIDWSNNKLVVTKPEKFSYKGNGEVLNVMPAAGGHFYTEVPVLINEKTIISKADIDIGNVSSYFSLRTNEDPGVKRAKQIANVITGWGANGPSYGNIARANLKLGSIVINSVVTIFSSTKATDLDGNIGISLLERFDPIFDFPHQRLILEKNQHFSEPFTYNQSGIILNPIAEENNLIVAGIIAGSPASNEDIRVGDKIVSINGLLINQLTKSKIKELILGKKSSEVELQLKRGTDLLSKKIKMKRLI